MRKLAFLLGLLMLPWAAFAADDEAAIRDTITKFVDAMNRGDAVATAGFYTEDTIMLPPDGSRIDGRAGALADLQAIVDAGITYSNIDVTDVGVDGDLAWNIGTWEAVIPGEGDESSSATGTYTVVWRRDGDGVWRILVDMWADKAAE